MSQKGSSSFFLILVFIGLIQGLQFYLDKTADSVYCGKLLCWAHKGFTDNNIHTVFSITVNDVTNSNSSVRLATLSVYDQDVKVHPTKINVINATGRIRRNSAQLMLGLRDHNDCTGGSFMCELDFVDLEGEPVLIRESSSGSGGNCLPIKEMFQGINEIDAQVDDLKKVSGDFHKEITQLKIEADELRKNNSQLKEELDKFLNQKVTCSRGSSFPNNRREKFLLWERIPALCDTETDGGGWIVIQRRTKGDVRFFNSWTDYKNGFGTPDTDFWIGNDVINNLTSQGYTELRIDIEFNGKPYFAHYSSFQVANETSNYRLTVTGYSGTATDGLTYHNNMQFSTYDRDNDNIKSANCALEWHGGWWYNSCYYSNLNGGWGVQDNTGNTWGDSHNDQTTVSFSEMKIRHV